MMFIDGRGTGSITRGGDKGAFNLQGRSFAVHFQLYCKSASTLQGGTPHRLESYDSDPSRVKIFERGSVFPGFAMMAFNSAFLTTKSKDWTVEAVPMVASSLTEYEPGFSKPPLICNRDELLANKPDSDEAIPPAVVDVRDHDHKTETFTEAHLLNEATASSKTVSDGRKDSEPRTERIGSGIALCLTVLLTDLLRSPM